MARDWRDYAACLGHDPELWFPEPKDTRTADIALGICARCPVKADCLAEAEDGRVFEGIWGGMTAADRLAAYTQAHAVTRAARSGEVVCTRCKRPKDAAEFGGPGGARRVRCLPCREAVNSWERRFRAV